jgi:hypothetical protein
MVATPGDMSVAPHIRADPAMVKVLARARWWQCLSDKGRCISTSELAAAEKLDQGYTGAILHLTLLAGTSRDRSWASGSSALLAQMRHLRRRITVTGGGSLRDCPPDRREVIGCERPVQRDP